MDRPSRLLGASRVALHPLVSELRPGLRRWTAFHEHWEEQVGSVAVETDDGLVLIDPLEPPLEELGVPAHVLLTVFWHARDARRVAEETGAEVWAHKRQKAMLERRETPVAHAFQPGDRLPGGIEAYDAKRGGEVVYWLPAHRALVVGDVLLGAGAKPRATQDPLRLCPERWLPKGVGHRELTEALHPLLDLPVELVLVSHGEPVLENGRDALSGVLGER